MSIEIESMNASIMHIDDKTFLRLTDSNNIRCWYLYAEEGWRRVAVAYESQTKGAELEALWQREAL